MGPAVATLTRDRLPRLVLWSQLPADTPTTSETEHCERFVAVIWGSRPNDECHGGPAYAFVRGDGYRVISWSTGAKLSVRTLAPRIQTSNASPSRISSMDPRAPNERATEAGSRGVCDATMT